MTAPSEAPGPEPKTTGHEWDGIRELDTPLPRWWLWIFYATIAFSIGYWVLFPAWPLIDDYTHGVLGHSDRAAVAQDLADLKTQRAAGMSRLASTPMPEIERDPGLREYAANVGRSVFGDNCATCHGVGGTGSPGYPNLRDDVWLWGGSLDQIYHTITVGVRADHPQTRMTVMPAFGRDALITPAQADDVTDFVLTLSSRAANPAAAARGRQVFADYCASCHGAAGRGDPAQGAPDLTDREWLNGDSREAIRAQVQNGRNGVMPSWEHRFDEATRRALAVYIHSEAAAAQ